MRFGLSFNLKISASSQYRNFDFNSMCMFNGKPIAVNSDGIFLLDDSETDNGTKINSIAELPTSILGLMHPKRLRSLYVGYETSGAIKFSVTPDGGDTTSVHLLPAKGRQIQHMGKVHMPRRRKGTYWVFKIENVNGCDFSIDHIQAVPIILSKGR